jgi:serine/threonine-protein kinase RsbT
VNATQKREMFPVRNSEDIVRVRQHVRSWATNLGFTLVDQTKIVTAASELARNAVLYGGGGEVTLEIVNNGNRRGLRLIFVDRGPGIPDIETAMRDGYTTGSGLGLGLGGARRLSHDFQIESCPGNGTRVIIARWN